jgi:hypothetical protein
MPAQPGVYASLAKSFAKTAPRATPLKVHIDQFQRADKTIGNIPINKLVDFRPLKKFAREIK